MKQKYLFSSLIRTNILNLSIFRIFNKKNDSNTHGFYWKTIRLMQTMDKNIQQNKLY